MVRTVMLAFVVGCASTAPAPRVPSNKAANEAQPVAVPTTWSILTTDQGGVIEGTAIDNRYQLPLVKAKIVATLAGTSRSVTVLTDDDGAFKLSGRPDGLYTIDVFYENVFDEHLGIQIDHSTGARVNMTLYREPGPDLPKPRPDAM